MILMFNIILLNVWVIMINIKVSIVLYYNINYFYINKIYMIIFTMLFNKLLKMNILLIYYLNNYIILLINIYLIGKNVNNH